MSTDRAQNKRNAYRVDFPGPVWGEMRILSLDGRPVHTKYAKIFLLDISAGGTKIQTRLSLPKNESLVIEVKFTIFHNEFKVKGMIARRQFNIYNFVIEYGVQFTLDDETQETLLVSTINLLTVRIKNNRLAPQQIPLCHPEEARNFYEGRRGVPRRLQ